MMQDTNTVEAVPEVSPWYRSETLDATVAGWFDSLATSIESWGLGVSAAGWVATAICVVGLGLACYLSNRITKWVIRHVVQRPFRDQPGHPINLLLKYKVITRLSHLVPLLLLSYGLPLLQYLYVETWTQPLIDIYIIWIGVMILIGLIDVVEIAALWVLVDPVLWPIAGAVQVGAPAEVALDVVNVLHLGVDDLCLAQLLVRL